MCGIASVLFYPQRRSPDTWEAIKNSFTENLLFNERRGEAATGIAIIRNNGEITIYKKPIPAHEFVITEGYKNLLNSLDEKTTMVLGHTRHPTKGNPINNHNNHPILVGSICGIHNGEILNDDDLFTKFKLPRQGDVDSEIIFSLLENLSQNWLDLESKTENEELKNIQISLQHLQGKFTFLSVDVKIPHRLLIVRYNNPLSLHYAKEWNSLLFSSSYLFLRKKFGLIVVNESLANNNIFLFDALKLPKLNHFPLKNIHLFSPTNNP